MKNFSIEDVQGNMRFSALTQGESTTVSELISNCNECQSQIQGFITTRKNVLHDRFDRPALMEYIEFLPSFDKNNSFMVMIAKNLVEKIGRDFVRDYMVEDFVKCSIMKLELMNGDKEAFADYVENYMKCEKIVPMAQSWKERVEELEEGKIIYYEPEAKRAV